MDLRFSSSEITAAAACLDNGAIVNIELQDPPPEPCCTQYIDRLHRPLAQLREEGEQLNNEVEATQQRFRSTIEIFGTTEDNITTALEALQQALGA